MPLPSKRFGDRVCYARREKFLSGTGIRNGFWGSTTIHLRDTETTSVGLGFAESDSKCCGAQKKRGRRSGLELSD
jgi:hypothetical protein